MVNHSGIIDSGTHFEIIPNTRKIVVPVAYKVIGTVGEHFAEQLTFKCPKLIDGHDIANCAKKYVTWKNSSGDIGHDELKNMTEDGENLYFTWDVSNSLTVTKGLVSFSVHFKDTDVDGTILYRWSTTICNECEILDSINADDVINPYDKGYVDGKQAEYDAFWKSFNPIRNSSTIARFAGDGWNVDTFRPNHLTATDSANYMFYGNDYKGDLTALAENLGITINLAPTSASNMFWYSTFTRIPMVDLRNASSVSNCFSNAKAVTIDKVILKEDGTQTLTNFFQSCTNLQNLVVEGAIGKTLDMSYCSKLTVASMKSVISCLKNYSGTGSEFSYELRFPEDRWTVLEADSTAPDGNTWREYVGTLGWNA